MPFVERLEVDRTALTLTCTSTGGPVSEVVWTRDGEPVTADYTLSQTVTDTLTGTYENVLRAANISDLMGNFSCTVSNSRGSSTSVTLSLGMSSSEYGISMACG